VQAELLGNQSSTQSCVDIESSSARNAISSLSLRRIRSMPGCTLPTDKVKRLASLLASRKYSSKTELAKVLRISRTTANKYSRLLENSGQGLDDISLMSPKEIRAALFVEPRANFDSDRLTDLVSIFPDIAVSISTREKKLLDCWKNYRVSQPRG